MKGMSDIFDFWSMDSHDERVVDHYEVGKLVIDTAAVNDGAKLYETGICHLDYNHRNWVIVEAYNTKKEAQAGHKRWIAKMTTEPLPEALIDCKNAKITSFADKMMIYPRKKKAKKDDGKTKR